MATYKITVEKTETYVGWAGREWKIVGEDENGKNKYDYTPEVEKHSQRTIQVYEQTVEELDLAALVSVVNNLNGKD